MGIAKPMPTLSGLRSIQCKSVEKQDVGTALRAFAPLRSLRLLGAVSLFDEREHLTRARDSRSAAIELRDQRLHAGGVDRAIESCAVGELIRRLVRRGIGLAPEPPTFFGAERRHRLRQMFATVPVIERRALGGIGDDGAHDEEAFGHGLIRLDAFVG